jgi:hypothetical protein
VLAELVSQPGADAMQSRSRGRDAQPELLSGGGDRVALQNDENEQVPVGLAQRAQARPQPSIDTESVGSQRDLCRVRLLLCPRQLL